MNEENEDGAKRYAEYLADEIRAEMGRQKVSNREMARRIAALGEARSEPTLSRLLRGTQRMTVDDAWLFAESLGADLRDLTQRAGARREADGWVSDVTPLTTRDPEEPNDGEH